MTIAAKNTESGFTLIELLVAMGISGIILGTIVSSLVTQRKSYAMQEQITEMMQNARAGMEVMTREVRMAGYDPTRNGFDGVIYHASQLQIQADRDGDGTPDDADEDLIYSHDNTTFQILKDTGSGPQILVDRIQDFTFDFLDTDGNPTTTNADIRQIRLTIIARTANPDPQYPTNGGHRTYTLMSLVTLRN